MGLDLGQPARETLILPGRESHQLTVALHDHHDVVEIVSYSAGQLPDRLHPLSLYKLLMQLRTLRLGLVALGNIRKGQDDSAYPSLCVELG